jgi:hypothetical protein
VGLRSDNEGTTAAVLSADKNRNTQSDSLLTAAPHKTSEHHA